MLPYESLTTKARLVLVPQYFGSLVYDRYTSQYMPFDNETTLLLKRLKSEPIDLVLSETKYEQHKTQIISFFEHFCQLGFFNFDQAFTGAILDIIPPQNRLVGPLTLHLEIMDSCNLKCKHCFAGKLPRREKPLTLDELGGLFASMANMGTFRLGLTGGEPLLRHDLFDIIDLAIEHGLSPCLTTNGLLITEEIAQALGKRELVWLNVSVEGATSKTHDSIRGKGTFDKLIKRLSILSKYVNFSLAFTIMRINLKEVQACAELADYVGAQAAVFRPLYPVGTARHYPELMPTFMEYIEALNGLSEAARNKSYEFCSVHPWGPLVRAESQSVIYENFGCGAGNTVCSVSVSGDVSPCSFLGSDYVAANVREMSLEDIWHHSHVFNAIRSLLGNDTCLNCSHYSHCGGGCRARAFALNRSINATDPWCTVAIN
jgi:radical SAM protein with 4Fe4S-binding SPASM domain